MHGVTPVYNKTWNTNNKVQLIMKKKPAVRDIAYELLTKVLHSQGCVEEYFSIKDLHNSLVWTWVEYRVRFYINKSGLALQKPPFFLED